MEQNSIFRDTDISRNDLRDDSPIDDFHPIFQRWWVKQFSEHVDDDGLFTRPQSSGIPKIIDGKNTLIASPTGTGKTLSSFSSVINDLIEKVESDEEDIDNSVYCLYISPLKSLANDIKRNLERPLEYVNKEISSSSNIRHAIRHGDTDSSERQKMLEKTPHIINTTPETLAILLNSKKFRQKLETVEYVIVDEIHSLAENKRGVHLSVSLERLQRISENNITRIGCSATVEPLDKVAKFLVGMDGNETRNCEIVDERFVREYDLKVESPVPNLIDADQDKITKNLYNRLDELISENDTTLVFTNTRSGSETVLQKLRQKFDEYNSQNSAAHHSSLSQEKRETVEKGLKNGKYDVVTTSTSLELGIDMQDISLVIQIGSPKSISGLLQRVGRAGHQLGKTVKGRIIVSDRDELIECSVIAKRAKEGYIDRIFQPKNCQDVASQHVYGMAINGPLPKNTVKKVLTRAYPYSTYSDTQFERLLKYLTGDYDNLEKHNIYPKIWVDSNDKKDGEYHYEDYEVGTELIGKKGKKAQMIYMTNIGTIPSSFSIQVFTRSNKWIGDLDEEYLNTIEKGDVFYLGGKQYKYKYRRGSKVYVDKTKENPTVPKWYSERLPLSYDLGKEIQVFQSKLSSHNNIKKILDEYPVTDEAKAALQNIYEQQKKFSGNKSFSTDKLIIIEKNEKPNNKEVEFYFQTVFGRKFNDGLSRLIAQLIVEEKNINVKVKVNDHGFTLITPEYSGIQIEEIVTNIPTNSVRKIIRKSLEDTDFFKRHFRINATRALMILKHYKGREKTAKQQQMASEMMLSDIKSLESFPILNETYREILEEKLSVEQIEKIIQKINYNKIAIRCNKINNPSPRSFSLASLSKSDVVSSNEESKVLQEFHKQVIKEIDGKI